MHSTIPATSRLRWAGLGSLPERQHLRRSEQLPARCDRRRGQPHLLESMQEPWRCRGRGRQPAPEPRERPRGPLLMDMLTVLREHRSMVVNLGLAWRGLYEYAAYLQALNNFRVLIGQWLLHRSLGRRGQRRLGRVRPGRWRTLGEGMLLIDMYEQWLAARRARPAPTSASCASRRSSGSCSGGRSSGAEQRGPAASAECAKLAPMRPVRAFFLATFGSPAPPAEERSERTRDKRKEPRKTAGTPAVSWPRKTHTRKRSRHDRQSHPPPMPGMRAPSTRPARPTTNASRTSPCFLLPNT